MCFSYLIKAIINAVDGGGCEMETVRILKIIENEFALEGFFYPALKRIGIAWNDHFSGGKFESLSSLFGPFFRRF
jgi:hypothetical protein